MPARQGSQASELFAPTLLEKNPAAQGVHSAAPLAFAYVPTGQEKQALAPGNAVYVPGSQLTQDATLRAPRVVPRVPGGQVPGQLGKPRPRMEL